MTDDLSPTAANVALCGWIGEAIDLTLANRVMRQDIGRVVGPFRERTEENAGHWRCEYWGKWFTSAALGYSYRPIREYRAVLERGVSELLATQTADGYIGTYRPEHHLGIWDVWGRKYTLLGLIAAYEAMGDVAALGAARRVADHFMAEAPSSTTNLGDLGIDVLKGLAPNSILEPMVLLHRYTGDERYLHYARSIVARWSRPSRFVPDGLRLLEHACSNTPPARYPSIKAYEMMSCFEGVCELYRTTHEPRLLEAAIAFARSVQRHEQMVIGSASNQELWCDGANAQTEVLEQPMETCVTVTWMKLCAQLLRLTRDSPWADELEISLYNALLGAMSPKGEWWAYWAPLHGERAHSRCQHDDVSLSCCVANGPRALLAVPQWSTMQGDQGIYVNLYSPGETILRRADGTQVRIRQVTSYPLGDEIILSVRTDRPARFALHLRIPAWSERSSLHVDGEVVRSVVPGNYSRIERTWEGETEIHLQLDLRGRAIKAPSGAPQLAVMRGPLVLALDNRLFDTSVIAVRLAEDGGRVEVTPRPQRVDGVRMLFDVTFDVRPSHYFHHHQVRLPMCDYASAANAWCADNLLRVWLPQPLLLSSAFTPGTAALMNSGQTPRPEIPHAARVPANGARDR